MRFQLLDIVFNPPHPVTGAAVPPADRLARVVEHAVLAEELGFDSYAVGERHAGEVLSSAPTVLLGALAARTSRILLSTGVTVLPLLDPVRAAEDLATVDQLSRGRLEVVIGKGNEVLQYPLLGLDVERQYEYLEENHGLLRLLLAQEDVTWSGRYRAPLEHATTLPRPFAGPFRVWHGSATSRFAVELAARHGEPIVSANALQPREAYRVLIDHYRERYAAHGHDPAYAFVGAGSGGLYLADTTQEAVAQYRPIFEGQVAAAARRGYGPHTVGKAPAFTTVEDAVAHGPALVGTPQQVADKILDYHEAFGHDLQSVSVNHLLDPSHQRDVLARFAQEVAPVVRAHASTRLWGPQDERRAAGFTAGEPAAVATAAG